MYAVIRDNTPEKISGAFSDNAGVQHPRNVLTLWSDAELAAIAVYPITDSVVPANYQVTGSSLFWNGAVVTRVFTYEPAPPPSLEQQRQARADAYREEADPLFFKAQRGEAELSEWEAKIQEIRDRYPYPEG